MIRRKHITGRFVDSLALALPFFLLAAFAGVIGWTGAATGLLSGAAVLLVAAIVAPNAATMTHIYFARFIAPVSNRMTDALILLSYAVLIPVGLAVRLGERLTRRPAKTYWRNG